MESKTLYKAHNKFTEQANKKVESLPTFHLYIIKQAILLTPLLLFSLLLLLHTILNHLHDFLAERIGFLHG